MNRRIFRSMLLVSLVTLLCGLTLIVGMLYDDFDAGQQRELQAGAQYLASGVEKGGLTYLAALTDVSRRITLIDTDGTVLFDNIADAATMGNHANREEFKEAQNSGAGQSTRVSETLTQRTIYYALRLSDGRVLRLSAVHASFWTTLAGTLPLIMAVVLAAAVLSGFLSYRLSRRITDPINAIDLENPAQAEIYEELAPLLSRIAHQNRVIARQLNEANCRQEEFRVITENMSEGILVIDHHTNLLSYNAAALTCLEVDDTTGSGSVLCLNRSVAFREVVNEALSGRHAERLLPLHGRIYNLMASPVSQEGKVAGAAILILDETEKVEREQLRREFTANVSHELKTPLTSISGFAELLKSGIVKDADIPDFATSIYDEAQRLIQLVNDIIRLSQMEDGTKFFEPTDVELRELAKDALSRVKTAAEKLGLSLTVTGGPVSVCGTETVLYEMIYNLCDNAVKYNRPGGSVEVLLQDAPETVSLTVKDTGIGIPPEHQSRVFERFYRVDKSHSKEIGGTGLGLSIVKHAAEYHHATLKMESRVGEGTAITVLFPKKTTDL
ncbi:MAG: histidine kinase [Clostridia bacterium]|nr:histidine kinase [Clostridia bacterium]